MRVMCHTKRDRILEPHEDGAFRGQVCVPLPKRQFAVSFEQLKRRYFDAVMPKRLKLQLFRIAWETDSAHGLILDQARLRIESRSPQDFDQLRSLQTRRHFRNVRVA